MKFFHKIVFFLFGYEKKSSPFRENLDVVYVADENNQKASLPKIKNYLNLFHLWLRFIYKNVTKISNLNLFNNFIYYFLQILVFFIIIVVYFIFSILYMTNTEKNINKKESANFIQQKTIKKIIKNFENFKKRKSSLDTFLEFTAVVMIWRWIRDLLDIRILPNYRRISCIICIVIWLIILIWHSWKIDELEKF